MPVLRVQPLVAVGQFVQLVALPPALNTAPLHCVHVAFAALLFAIIQPASADTAYVVAGHAVPLYVT